MRCHCLQSNSETNLSPNVFVPVDGEVSVSAVEDGPFSKLINANLEVNEQDNDCNIEVLKKNDLDED